ncbi:solute carrier family 23 protein [Insolitispirillum peregrinum]|uniref:Uracil permease n=1 Tax=Insolitispirillum peregrinum TaxID=80876 RepID=A0A1N7NS82_9PROT|nr:solute carrier family 23 protein [Insolitispirillum peregrinum]SIT01152.1 uracil permease [Insolitispirillum peregrinum]
MASATRPDGAAPAAAPDIVLDIHEKPSLAAWLPLSAQHLFAMFGATILVPYLTGLSPSVALVTSGIGTLLYIVCTRGRIPAYLGSSFAFIAPLIAGTQIAGVEGALVAAALSGVVYIIVAFFIWRAGIDWLLALLPPVVVGPVIMCIGLSLAPVAVGMAMNDPLTKAYSTTHLGIALFTLAVTIGATMFLRGVFALVPVLFGIIAGYTASIAAGLVDFSTVINAPLFAMPAFTIPGVTGPFTVSLSAILIIAPVALVTITEHLGDQMVLSKVTGRNFLVEPGLHRSILGDGLATALAGMLGGPPNTTYGENVGVIAITRVMSVWVIGGAAVLATLFGFLGSVSALIQTVPTAVMGGVSMLLFGVIASSGLRMLIDRHVDLGRKRNLIIVSVILVMGIGKVELSLGSAFTISNIALATLVGVVLNLILPGRDKADKGGSIFQKTEA